MPYLNPSVPRCQRAHGSGSSSNSTSSPGKIRTSWSTNPRVRKHGRSLRRPYGNGSAPSWRKVRLRQRKSPPPSDCRKKRSRITWNTFGKASIPRGAGLCRFRPNAGNAGSSSGSGTVSRRRADVPSAREKRFPTRRIGWKPGDADPADFLNYVPAPAERKGRSPMRKRKTGST